MNIFIWFGFSPCYPWKCGEIRKTCDGQTDWQTDSWMGSFLYHSKSNSWKKVGVFFNPGFLGAFHKGSRCSSPNFHNHICLYVDLARQTNSSGGKFAHAQPSWHVKELWPDWITGMKNSGNYFSQVFNIECIKHANQPIDSAMALAIDCKCQCLCTYTLHLRTINVLRKSKYEILA